MAAPTNGIMKKLQRIERSLDAIESGRYSELTLSQCCDYIAWVAKFKKVPRKTWLPLCERATQLLSLGRDA